eukprot:m.123085 g.123085  ORF g.123085 m.123085 type:complete len:87 (+) comp28960_c0_seq1:2-262(+)
MMMMIVMIGDGDGDKTECLYQVFKKDMVLFLCLFTISTTHAPMTKSTTRSTPTTPEIKAVRETLVSPSWPWETGLQPHCSHHEDPH